MRVINGGWWTKEHVKHINASIGVCVVPIIVTILSFFTSFCIIPFYSSRAIAHGILHNGAHCFFPSCRFQLVRFSVLHGLQLSTTVLFFYFFFFFFILGSHVLKGMGVVNFNMVAADPFLDLKKRRSYSGGYVRHAYQTRIKTRVKHLVSNKEPRVSTSKQNHRVV